MHFLQSDKHAYVNVNLHISTSLCRLDIRLDTGRRKSSFQRLTNYMSVIPNRMTDNTIFQYFLFTSRADLPTVMAAKSQKIIA